LWPKAAEFLVRLFCLVIFSIAVALMHLVQISLALKVGVDHAFWVDEIGGPE
jgi:hypothetical protein